MDLKNIKRVVAKEWVVILCAILVGLFSAVMTFPINQGRELLAKKIYQHTLQHKMNKLPTDLRTAVEKHTLELPDSSGNYAEYAIDPHTVKFSFENPKHILEVVNIKTDQNNEIRLVIPNDEYDDFISALKFEVSGFHVVTSIKPLTAAFVMTFLSYLIIQFLRISRWSIAILRSQKKVNQRSK